MAIAAWDETAPAGASKIRLGDDEIRNTKEQIRRRENQGGHIWDAGALAEEGRHAIDAGGAGVGPHLYESDGSTLIIEYQTNILAEIASSTWKLQSASGETKNMHSSIMDDDLITSDAKGFKRHVQGLRVSESDPVDTLVNIAAGMQQQASGATVVRYAGGSLTIGTGDLALPAAGNHAYFLIYLDTSGVLTGLSGAEVLLASTPVPPLVPPGTTPLCVIDVLDTSVDFSLAASAPNAFLVEDYRVDSVPSFLGWSQIGEDTLSTFAEQGNIIVSKAITTTGGIVFVCGCRRRTNTGSDLEVSIGRSGVPLAQVSATPDPSVVGALCLVAFEAIAAGTYTYQLRANSTGGSASLWVAEIGLDSFF